MARISLLTIDTFTAFDSPHILGKSTKFLALLVFMSIKKNEFSENVNYFFGLPLFLHLN